MNFAFNSDISTTKNTEVRGTIQREIDLFSKERDALNELTNTLKNTKEPIKVQPDKAWDKATFETADFQFTFELSPFWGYTDKKNLLKRNLLDIMDKGGNLVSTEEVFITGPEDKTPTNRPGEIQAWIDSIATPTNVEIYEQMIAPLTSKVVNALEAKKGYLVSVNNNKNQNYWSFWDFFYFSAITQTTVGYGDILPNSTTVRIAVVIQIFLGILMLVISINVVFSRRRPSSA
jgi:hypothetical protein